MTNKGNITSLFGKSPISPLQQHMKKVHSCIKEFGVFAKALMQRLGESPSSSNFNCTKRAQSRQAKEKVKNEFA